MRPSLACLAAALLVPAAACGDDPAADPAPDAPAEVEPDAPEVDPPATVSVSGTVWHTPPNVATPPTPFAGAEVCFVVAGVSAPCTTAAADGTYQLADVPADTFGAVRFAGEGSATFYWLLATEDTDVQFGLLVDTPEIVAGYYSQAGATPTPGRAVVLAEIYPLPRPDYVATLTPASELGPYYYLDFSGALDLAAQATSADIALGVFLDVDRTAGPFELSFVRDGAACTGASFGGPRAAFEIPDDADVVYAPFACP